MRKAGTPRNNILHVQLTAEQKEKLLEQSKAAGLSMQAFTVAALESFYTRQTEQQITATGKDDESDG